MRNNNYETNILNIHQSYAPRFLQTRDEATAKLAGYRLQLPSPYIRGVESSLCVQARESFWNITGEYFKNEARYDFGGEAALWAVLTLTAFLPLITNAHAVMEFVRAIGN
jgi:hypothetical protein